MTRCIEESSEVSARTDNRGGLLVVERSNPFTRGSRYRSTKERKPAVPLSHDEILLKYRGIEGWPWPEDIRLEAINIENGLASVDQIDLVLDYYATVANGRLCDLICLQFSSGSKWETSALPMFIFLGYDYGYYNSEFSYYSVVDNEVIYGLHDELRSFGGLLNENLLLPTLDAVTNLDRTREQLLAQGADLETSSPARVIRIYGPPRAYLESLYTPKDR